jgi:cell division protein FtsL
MRVLLVMVGVILLLLYVWERIDIVRVGYQVEQLKNKKLALERERDELQVKVSALTSPERIARVAADKLGMIPPLRGQVIFVNLKSEGVFGGVDAIPEVKLARNEMGRRVP